MTRTSHCSGFNFTLRLQASGFRPQASTLADVDDVYTGSVELTAILLQLHKQEMSFDFGKLFGRGDPSKKTDAVLQYNERRFRQMATFYGCTIAAYIASKIAYRGVIKRRYNPNFYQHNHVPPKFNFYKDAMAAVTHSTLLATSMMAMIGSGAFWYCDISTIKEFTSRMKVFLGGDEAERALKAMPEDAETKQITDSLDSLLNGNLLDAFGEEEEEEGVKVTKK